MARSRSVSLEATPYYHCIGRCVRRAFLWGKDRFSGRDFSHRKAWVVERLAELSELSMVSIVKQVSFIFYLYLIVKTNEPILGQRVLNARTSHTFTISRHWVQISFIGLMTLLSSTIRAEDLPQAFNTLYFVDSQAELKDRNELHERVARQIQLIRSVPINEIRIQLEEVESLIIGLQRHAAYTRMTLLQNVDDESMAAASSQVRSDIVALRAAVDARFLEISPLDFPQLWRFSQQAQDVYLERQNGSNHQLSSEAAIYQGKVVFSFQKDVARSYASSIEAIESAPKGLTATRSDTQQKAMLSESRRAHLQKMEAYESAANEISGWLASQVSILNRDAKMRAFPNAAEQKYASIGSSSSSVSTTLKNFERGASSYRRYEDLLKRHAQHQLGVLDVNRSDLELLENRFTPLSFEQAREVVLAALAPLGADFHRRMSQLLDPKNGRLSLSGGTHRSAAAGTSIAVYDAPVALYMGKFSGTLKDVAIMAHEGGHAIHREILNESGLTTYHRNGPGYLFEAHGILNDLLVLNYVAEHAESPRQRMYALEAFLEKISLEVFGSAQETSFEKALYENAPKIGLLRRSDIDRMYREAIKPYDTWNMSDKEITRSWIQKSHVFDDPLYYVNYLYSGLCAFTMFNKISSDPDFARRYEAFVKRGFDAPTSELLQSIDIRFDDPSVMNTAFQLFESKTDQLEKLYQELGELAPPR